MTAPFPRPRILSACALLLATAVAKAQSEIYHFEGTSHEQYFGAAIAWAGDVDADQISDYIYTWKWTVGGVTIFEADVRSGATGNLITRVSEPVLASGGTSFALSSFGSGDVTGDGRADVLLGLLGVVRIHSGASGAEVLSVRGNEATGFGNRLSWVGDVNADGVDDFVTSAPDIPFGDGVASIRSGVDGSVIHSWLGSYQEGLGSAVTGLGDVDGDGVPDVGVGTWGGAAAYIYSGADGSTVHALQEGQAGGNGGLFGRQVAGVGDFDGDGTPDMLVTKTNHGTGRVQVRSGATGAVIVLLSAPAGAFEFGRRASSMGDVNGDGFMDVAVGMLLDGGQAAETMVYLGPDGAPYMRIEGSVVVTDAGDVTGDGASDFVLGDSAASNIGLASGLVSVRSGRDDCNANGSPDSLDVLAGVSADCNKNGVPDECDIASGASLDLDANGEPDDCLCSFTVYCTTFPGSSPWDMLIGSNGDASVSANTFRLWADLGPPNKPGLFFYGSQQASIPFGNGELCVGGQTYRLPVTPTDIEGLAFLEVDFDDPPTATGQITAGSAWNFQYWFRDTSVASESFNVSSALHVVFCP